MIAVPQPQISKQRRALTNLHGDSPPSLNEQCPIVRLVDVAGRGIIGRNQYSKD